MALNALGFTAFNPTYSLQQDADAFLRSGAMGGLDSEAIENLVAERRKARTDHDFKRADEIRDELAAGGIVLEDTADGTLWRRH